MKMSRCAALVICNMLTLTHAAARSERVGELICRAQENTFKVHGKGYRGTHVRPTLNHLYYPLC